LAEEKAYSDEEEEEESCSIIHIDNEDSEEYDIEWLDRKIHELSCIFQKSNDIPQDVLEGLFHSLFPRRHTKVELLEAGVILLSAMNTNPRVKNKIIRVIMKKITAFVSNAGLSLQRIVVGSSSISFQNNLIVVSYLSIDSDRYSKISGSRSYVKFNAEHMESC
jgi:hypothetical protein